MSGRRPADKPRKNSGFCYSIGLAWVSFVRASEESFRTVFYNALGNKRVACSLGDITGRPCPPRRPAVRRPAHPACGVSVS